jgi:hypothetical protein
MLALTLTVTPDDALNGAVGRNNCRSLATMLIGGLAISHDRNLHGHHRTVNPVCRHYMASSVRSRNPLSRPLLGVKRTWLVAMHMSAFDPKRTCLSSGSLVCIKVYSSFIPFRTIDNFRIAEEFGVANATSGHGRLHCVSTAWSLVTCNLRAP